MILKAKNDWGCFLLESSESFEELLFIYFHELFDPRTSYWSFKGLFQSSPGFNYMWG